MLPSFVDGSLLAAWWSMVGLGHPMSELFFLVSLIFAEWECERRNTASNSNWLSVTQLFLSGLLTVNNRRYVQTSVFHWFIKVMTSAFQSWEKRWSRNFPRKCTLVPSENYFKKIFTFLWWWWIILSLFLSYYEGAEQSCRAELVEKSE